MENGLYELWKLAMRDLVFEDARLSAQKDMDELEYSHSFAVHAEVAWDFTDAREDYDDIDYVLWDERLDLEPDWTDAEDAHGYIGYTQECAGEFGDATLSWELATLRNTK